MFFFVSMAGLTVRPLRMLRRLLGRLWTIVGWLPGPASRLGVLCVLLLALTPAAFAEFHPSVPAFSSSPGAAYTIYLDFAGFNFPGDWHLDPETGIRLTPGVTPAYDTDGTPAAFSPTELANIQNVWSRVAEKYAPFNVNVTTVDPFVAGDLGTTDALRTHYYDTQPQMMHTVIGGDNTWNGGGGGTSQLGVTAAKQSLTNGYHTNWVFSALAPTDLQFVGEAAAHENGHGLGLSHQSDYSASGDLLHEYSLGTGTGPGTKAPTMGNPYFKSPIDGTQAERGTWKDGTALGPTPQNDPKMILGNVGMELSKDGIGHRQDSATPLPTDSLGHIDSSHAKGVIVPSSSTDPVSSGEDNYSKDFWSFTTAAGLVMLTVNAGGSWITPGVADPGATLDSTLRVFDANGVLVDSSAHISLSETLWLILDMGTYYAEVVSAGDEGNPDFADLGFFDMGSYFLSGDINPVAVPEPSTFALLAVGLALAAFGMRRRRRG